MRTALLVIVSCLLISGGTATAFPFGGCPDLAYTGIFQSKGLGYVRSREFAEAVRAVAIGASKYSPKEIPASWRVDAESWIEPGSEKSAFQKGEDACNPVLLYMASMEYRAMPGHGDVTPVFPINVRAATREARVVAEWKKAGPFAERAAAVEFKIAVAERMGAGDCARVELESAKLLLDRARNVVSSSRNNTDGVDWLDRAERIADSLLANRRFAFRQGVWCTAMSE